MGNEGSTPVNEAPEETPPRRSRAPLSSTDRHRSNEASDFQPRAYGQQSFPSGSLMNTNTNTNTSGSLRASNEPKGKTFVDPVLSAAAAGAAARQAKQSRIVQQQQLAKQQTLERQRQQAAPAPSQNEWTASLKRLATTAASTAATVAHVAAPMVQDTGRLVKQSAKEAATTYRDEFRKVDFSSFETNDYFVNEEESVDLWTRSPTNRSHFLSSSGRIITMSPSTDTPSPMSPKKIATINLFTTPPLPPLAKEGAAQSTESPETSQQTSTEESEPNPDSKEPMAGGAAQSTRDDLPKMENDDGATTDIPEKAATDPLMIPTELETPLLDNRKAAQSTLVPRQGSPFEDASHLSDIPETMQQTPINDSAQKYDSEESAKEDAAPSTDVTETTQEAPIEEFGAKPNSEETAKDGAAQSTEPLETSQQTTEEPEPKPDSEEPASAGAAQSNCDDLPKIKNDVSATTDTSGKVATDPPIPTELETPVLDNREAAQSTPFPKQDDSFEAIGQRDPSPPEGIGIIDGSLPLSINEPERKDESEGSTKDDAAPPTGVPETTQQAPIEELEAKPDSEETTEEVTAQSTKPADTPQQTSTEESEPKPDSEESATRGVAPKMENATIGNGFNPSVPQSDLVRCFICYTRKGKVLFSKSQLKKKNSKCKQCVDKQNGAYQEPQGPAAGKVDTMLHSSTQEAMDPEPAKEVSEGESAGFDSSAQKQSENTADDTRTQLLLDGPQGHVAPLSQSGSIEKSPITPQDNREYPAEIAENFAASSAQNVSLKGVTHKTNFALSTVEPDGIYENDGEYSVDARSDASNTHSPTPTEDLYSRTHRSTRPQGPQRFTTRRVERSGRPDSSQSQQPLFDNPKSFVEYVTSRLTGYQVRIEERASQNDENTSWIKATGVKTYDPRESVFAQELFQVRSPSLSPPGSPPEARSLSVSDNEGENEPLADSSVAPVSTLWDFIPNKRDVENKSEIEEQDIAEFEDSSSSVGGGHDIGDGAKENREARSLTQSNPSQIAMKRQRKRVSTYGIGSPSRSKVYWKPSTGAPFGQAPPLHTTGAEGAEEGATFPEQQKDGPESLLVGWDQEAALNSPSVPDTEDMTIGLEREELLDEALLAFSSLENIEFLDKIPRRKLSDENMKIAAVRWRQLLAHWKHSEIWKALNTRPCSIHFLESAGQSELPEDADSLSSSASVFRYNDGKATLDNALSADEALSAISKLSGSGVKVGGSEFLVMTGYLCDIGPSDSSQKLVKQKDGDESTLLRHKLATDDAGEESFSLTDLLKHAEMNLTEFTEVVRHIVEFSSQNNSTTTYGITRTVSYTVGIKNYSSIRRKAALKYSDDILQVKDVLRGQINFPDEAALVCGLYSLNDLCAQPQQLGKEASRHDWPKIEIVRLKNLFRVSPLGNYFPSSLPTGYRHILVHIRLGDTIIAGKFLIIFRCRHLYDSVGLTHILQKFNFNSLRYSMYWVMKVTHFIKKS